MFKFSSQAILFFLAIFLISCSSFEDNFEIQGPSYMEESSNFIRNNFKGWRTYSSPHLTQEQQNILSILQNEDSGFLATVKGLNLPEHSILWPEIIITPNKHGHNYGLLPVFVKGVYSPQAFIYFSEIDGSIVNIVVDYKNDGSIAGSTAQRHFFSLINDRVNGAENLDLLKIETDNDADVFAKNCNRYEVITITSTDWYQCAGAGDGQVCWYTDTTIDNVAITDVVDCPDGGGDDSTSSGGGGLSTGYNGNDLTIDGPELVIPCITFNQLFNNGSQDYTQMAIEVMGATQTYYIDQHNTGEILPVTFEIPSFVIEVTIGHITSPQQNADEDLPSSSDTPIDANQAAVVFDIAFAEGFISLSTLIHEYYGVVGHNRPSMTQAGFNDLFFNHFQSSFDGSLFQQLPEFANYFPTRIEPSADTSIPNVDTDCL